VRRHQKLVGLLAFATLLASATPSFADETPSLAILPAPAGELALLTEPAAVRGDGHLRFRVIGLHSSEPLVLQNEDQEFDRVVSEQTFLHALASLSFAHRFQASLGVPLVLRQATGSAAPHGATAARPSEDTLLGDVVAGGRVKLVGPAGNGEHLAIAAALALPTGTDYAGDGGFGAGVRTALDGMYARWFWITNVGVRLRPRAKLPGIVPTRVGSELALGVAQGTYIGPGHDWLLTGELGLDLTFGDGAKLFDPRGTRALFLIEGRYRPVEALELGAGFGPGVGQAPGAADYRALVFLGFTPEVVPPPPDRDDDKIEDRADACIDLPGVPSPDPLMNGCPELPPDFDSDEIPDAFDACPKEPGIPTGRRETHGCPKPVDTDGDGIVDRKDACPREKGVKSADPAKNGCPPPPPPPPPVARLEQEEIVISQQVQFEHGTAVLRPESDPILAEVARVLTEHPELEQVEVQGHTDDTGTPEINQKLSQERAEAVRTWLVAHGTESGRLLAKGYGQSAPIADNGSEEGRAKNRRVQFKIVKGPPKEPKP